MDEPIIVDITRRLATGYFVIKVMPNGKWDCKNQSNWNLTPQNDYYWHGVKICHYGYVGKVLFDTETLLAGAGIAQLSCDILKRGRSQWHLETNFDDPQDQKMVAAGCMLWDYGF